MNPRYQRLRRNSVALLLGLFWCTTGISQSLDPFRQWSRIWGTAEQQEAFASCVDVSNNVYVCGATDDSIDGQPFAGGHSDCFITSFGADGSLRWTKMWGSTWSSGQDAARALEFAGGYIYVSGDSYYPDFDGQASIGDRDLFLTKFDVSGTRLWSQVWGSTALDYTHDMCIDSGTNIYVTGATQGSFGGQINQSYDHFVTKLDTSGTQLWTRIWGSAVSDEATSVCVDDAGHVYVSGWTSGDIGSVTNPGQQSMTLTKFTASGTQLWVRIWGPDTLGKANAVTAVEDGSIYVTGSVDGDFDGQAKVSPTSLNDIFLSKFDSTGNRLWSRIWGSEDDQDDGRGVVAAGTNCVYVFGHVDDDVYGQSCPGFLGACLSKFGVNGDHVWTRLWGSPNAERSYGASGGDEGGHTIAMTASGDLYVNGETYGEFDGQTNPVSGTRSAWLSKWTDPDADSDGMGDEWELDAFGNLSHDGTGDEDKDGSNDREEFIAGTSPTNILSVFGIEDVSSVPPLYYVLQWNSATNRVYRIYSCTNLITPAWTSLYEVAGSGLDLTYTNALDVTRRFFKATVELTTP